MPEAKGEGGSAAGRPSLNALGPRATSGARPTGISRRDSLPPLNAMPVVQVTQSVQCVLGKRDVADAGRSYACAHLRWPTPVRPAPDSRVKGRDFQMFGEGPPGQGRIWGANADRKAVLSTLWGPRPDFRQSAPTVASSRNSLPALNAAAVVQVTQTVQRVLRKRDVAVLGKRKGRALSRRNSLPPLIAMPVVQVPQAEQRVLRKRDVVALGRRKGKRSEGVRYGKNIADSRRRVDVRRR